MGKRNGALSEWHPTDLLALTFRTLVARTGVDPDSLDDVIGGCVLQVGEQSGNLTRFASLGAGLPQSLPAVTIDRQCGSGQQAVHFAAQGVRSGQYNFAIAAGVESMSRVDLGPLFDPNRPRAPFYGTEAMSRYDGNLCAQGPSAEIIVRKWGLSRRELDEYSMESHRRARVATEGGFFADHLVPVPGIRQDEGVRAHLDPTKMAALKPAFEENGAITAANASQLSDGAAALLIAEQGAAEDAGLSPKAIVRAMAVAADDPVLQFTAVIPAARIALDAAGLSIHDIDRIEVNEAFAPVPIIFAREFGIGYDKLNVNGGSIAIGHPLGSTGARMITDLVYELHRSNGRYGLLAICEGGGMANATIVERI